MYVITKNEINWPFQYFCKKPVNSIQSTVHIQYTVEYFVFQVHEEVSVALLDRKSLRYEGARVQPLPPPAPKPNSQKAPPPRERFIKDAFGGKQKVMTYNWRRFTMGIGLTDVKDIG